MEYTKGFINNKEAQSNYLQHTLTHTTRQSVAGYNPTRRTLKQDHRTASNDVSREMSQEKRADIIGRFSETATKQSQSRSSSLQVTHQPFKNMSKPSGTVIESMRDEGKAVDEVIRTAIKVAMSIEVSGSAIKVAM
jgi:hypothetical protein